MTEDRTETVKTRIWFEEPQEDNPFAPAASYCAGYDVYGELLGRVSWSQYLYLLFRQELPDERQEALLETLAVAIANPGIRDHSVRAAMNAGVGGSSRASALMAATAVGAGNLGGAREVYQWLQLVGTLGRDAPAWRDWIAEPVAEQRIDVWLPLEHVPGFDPNGASCPPPVLQTLQTLADIAPGGTLEWLCEQRAALEAAAGYPLAFSGVAGAALHDLGCTPPQGEMLYLLLRLPGAAAHALEQEEYGWRRYPFFGSSLEPLSSADYRTWLDSLKEGE